MGYSSWVKAHAKKHKRIMQKLTACTEAEVIAYFRYENMVKHEPDFCPLYAKDERCHQIESLNCYLCGCPNFRFDDKGFEIIEQKSLKSYCSIESPDGAVYEGVDALHQACSSCTIPHDENYISDHFKRDWLEIMSLTECQ